MMTINLEFKSPATNLLKDVVSVLRNAEIVALFVACFVLGMIFFYFLIKFLNIEISCNLCNAF